jgi:hypothetical protein
MLLILEPSSRAAHVTVGDSVFDLTKSKKKRPSSANEIYVDPEDLRFRSKEKDRSEVPDSRQKRSSTPIPQSKQRISVDQANFDTPSMRRKSSSRIRGSVCSVQLAMRHTKSLGESAERGINKEVDKLMNKLRMANVPFALVKESLHLLKCVDHEGIFQGGSAYEV